MNDHDDLDRMLSAWLDDPLIPPAPRYLDTVLERTRRTRQRPAWTSLERWLPMTATLRNPARPVPTRLLAIGLVLLALLIVLTAVPFLAGALLSLRPEGSTSNGLIAFERDGDIYVVDPPDGAPRLLVGGPDQDVGPQWSPDGRRLLFVRLNGAQEVLMVTDAAGSPPSVVDPQPLWQTSWIDWSPDGSVLAVASEVDGVPTISLFEADGSGELGFDRGTGEPWSLADMPTWRPTDDFASYRALLYRSIGDEPRILMAEERVPSDPSTGACPQGAPRCAGSDELVLRAQDIDGGRPAGFGGTYDFLDPAWAPDGDRFAYHTLQDLGDAAPDDPGFRVHVARPGASGVQPSDVRIEHDVSSADEHGVSWSPDGSRIAFQAFEQGSSRLVIMKLSPETDVATGTVTTEALPAPTWDSLGYAWAPDGSKLVLVNKGAPTKDAYLVDAATGDLEALDWKADDRPSWQVSFD